MAYYNYDSEKSGVLGTANANIFPFAREMALDTANKGKIFAHINWLNLGNYNTSGTSGTSGTGGTTIVVGGDYTWIG